MFLDGLTTVSVTKSHWKMVIYKHWDLMGNKWDLMGHK